MFEFPVAWRRFFFPGMRCVFVPMYDNEWASVWQYRRIAWSGMGVIAFSERVASHARRCGVRNVLEVCYFPDPSALPRADASSRRVFLWERGDIGAGFARKLFPPEDGWTLDVKRPGEDMPRDAYLARLARCSAFVAPRMKEGIGMSFLEAMAMGMCVAANRDATMDEYVEDGRNGILFDARNPSGVSAVSRSAVSAAAHAAASDAPRLRERWLADAERIAPFIRSLPPCRPSLSARLKLALSFPLYVAEGVLFRLRSRFRRPPPNFGADLL